ncbi:GAR1 [Enterospora canceri]|uniref:H/ACA ribonucleoprotein complex subunit n=1 Tax=Enterospora canceri TaxID=1081671 RepID=A0A1Y1S7F8_9MICR|nr:GAR1 [Enterospora canceri]
MQNKLISPMAFNRNKQRRPPLSGETIRLGEFSHSCGSLAVVKLTCKSIPYPSSPVLVNKKPVGKIDEIFGILDDSYASIELTDASYLQKGVQFDGHKEKFMPKERLVPREETIKKKEKEDKASKQGGFIKKPRGKKEFKSQKFARIKKQMKKY